MHICYRVTNCLLFYSEEEDHPEVEVVEIAPLSSTAEEEWEAASHQGVSEYCTYGDIYHISHF